MIQVINRSTITRDPGSRETIDFDRDDYIAGRITQLWKLQNSLLLDLTAVFVRLKVRGKPLSSSTKMSCFLNHVYREIFLFVRVI
jgi:hypothetical protein